MRAKTIHETHNNFERGNDPKIAMGTGKVAEAKKMLDKYYNGKYIL